MAAENQLKRSEERIEFRIGINLGDIIVDGNDIAGDGVNVAARLEALAEPGGICVSAAVREQVHGSLDVSFNDIGDQRVKNIMRPIRVFAVGLDAARASDPTTRQSNTRREARETDSSGFALDKSVHRRFLLVAALAALTAVGALLLWWNWQRPRAPEPPALSVGVLPLVAPSGTPAATQRLASLTRDISAILARTDVSIRILPVTLRQSSEVNHDDIGELARPIQVRYLLEGEVQLGPEATEIRLRLVKGASGEQVWNETVSLKEPAAVADQNRGLRRVMEHLQARLFEVEMQRVTAAGGFRTTPMDDALRALALDKTQKSLDRLRRQEAMYEEALRRDPDLVPALLGVFHALDGQIDVDSNVDRARVVRRMDEVTTRAVRVSRDSADAWSLRSGALVYMGLWDAALEANATAIKLDPDAAYLVANRAWLMSMVGKPAEGLHLLKEAIEIDPPGTWGVARYECEAHLLLGQYDQAIVACEKARAKAGEDFDIASFLAAAYAQTGATARAKEETIKILRASPGFTIAALRAKQYSTHPEYMRLAETHWYTGLRKAGIPEK